MLTGVDQLAEGSIALSDGMIEFNEAGVQKLANLVKNDAQGRSQIQSRQIVVIR